MSIWNCWYHQNRNSHMWTLIWDIDEHLRIWGKASLRAWDKLFLAISPFAHLCAAHWPAQHELGVLAVDVFFHQLQQQSSHDISVVFQLPMQSHCQQGGTVNPGPGIEVMTALEGADKLKKKEEKREHKSTQKRGISLYDSLKHWSKFRTVYFKIIND